MFGFGLCGLFHQRMELLIELVHEYGPFLFAFRHFVELLFHAGCEVVIHNFREVLHEEIIYHNTHIGRKQLGLFIASHFRLNGFGYLVILEFQYIKLALYTFLVSLFHISSLLDGRNSRCICRRTTDAQFLELTHQAGFGIARRTQREALDSRNFGLIQYLTHHQRRQQTAFIFLFLFFIVRFLVHSQETIENNHFTHRNKSVFTIADSNGSRSLFQFGIRHLRSDGTLPNQLIQSLFLGGS